MGQYLGKYRGVISRRDDPQRRGRVKVVVPKIFENIELSEWALPNFPYGGFADAGRFEVPPVGANVWVEFEAPSHTISRPIWTGTFPVKPAGVSTIPNKAKGIADSTVSGRVSHTSSNLSIKLPSAPEATTYPENKVFKTDSGHVMEFDDTPGKERFAIFHKDGHFVEMRYDGTRVDVANGLWHQHSEGNRDVTVVGTHREEASGDRVISSKNFLLRDFDRAQFGSSGAAEAFVLGTTFLALYDSHTHLGNLGGTTSTPQAKASSKSLSTKNFGE